jgi:hypothetical protein
MAAHHQGFDGCLKRRRAIAGAVSGVAATDAPRRDPSDDEIRRIRRAEITECEMEGACTRRGAVAPTAPMPRQLVS